MHVGLVIERFDPQHGGAEHWTFQHARQLVELGHEVHVVAGQFGAEAARHPFVLHDFGRLNSRTKRAAAAEAILRQLRLDVVHDIGLGWFCDVLQSEDGSRCSQWEHRLAALPKLVRPFKRALIQCLPRYAEMRELMSRQYSDDQRVFIAVSKMCAEDYRRYHGVADEQIRIVYHGTDLERFSPRHRIRYRDAVRRELGVEPGDVVFLFVGHDHRRKGLKAAVRAVSRLASRGAPARLLVVGGKRKMPPRRRTSRDVVLHVGRVADPVPYYASSDVFVLPTWYDPCSLSVGEAAACGLPVVTTVCNGAAEMLTEGRDGFILRQPQDVSTLERQLETLLDQSVRDVMGRAARQTAEQYSQSRNSAEITAIYEEVVRRRMIIPFRMPAVRTECDASPRRRLSA
jgi:UDP-glucose:(heptosyl)LPS alpha-1,3-glucosyltransferase